MKLFLGLLLTAAAPDPHVGNHCSSNQKKYIMPKALLDYCIQRMELSLLGGKVGTVAITASVLTENLFISVNLCFVLLLIHFYLLFYSTVSTLYIFF